MYLEEIIENIHSHPTISSLFNLTLHSNLSLSTYEEIIDMSVKSKNTQYDILTSDVKYDASKFTILRDFYSAHNDGKIFSEKALQSMGFYNKDGLLANGALLFADDYREKKTEVQCSVFSGFNKGSERIVTINRFQGNIISTRNLVSR